MLAERVGGSIVTWPLLAYLFLDWDMWSFAWRYITKLACPVYCPIIFQEKKTSAPSIPPHYKRFKRYMPGMFLNAGPDSCLPLSKDWDWGLRFSRSSVVPAINIAYLQGAAEIVLLGVDLNDYTHFNDAEYGPEGLDWGDQPYPQKAKIVGDLERIAKFLEIEGVRCWNCSPDSAVRGWKKVSLNRMLKQANRQFLERAGNTAVVRM